MKLHYQVTIDDPKTHKVKVVLSGERTEKSQLQVFLPSWSPGSYLMREYSRHVQNFRVLGEKGEALYFEKKTKGIWEINWHQTSFKNSGKKFTVEYEVYCHDISVRTSFIDESHAFLHGPAYLMGVMGTSMENPTLSIKFPALWSKVSTGLKDISPTREQFLYTAKNYDELIDTPIEIGCHETDGFVVQKVEHALAFYGETFPHANNLKNDMQKIVEYITTAIGEIPFENYQFITHFLPDVYGGLEHLNSCALHFDGRKLNDRKAYIKWLTLVSHEYFHAWNVKRIRPQELGPFNYTEENYTRLLWLAEGLTSFVDDWFVWKAGLCTEQEYWDIIKENINLYLNTPGRKFDSLEDSSFDAWIKLYRPDENSKNSSVSYYLKGGLVFLILNVLLQKKNKSVLDLVHLLWQSYKKNPQVGLNSGDVFAMVESLGGKEIREQFETMVLTTQEINFEKYLKIEWEQSQEGFLGVDVDYVGDRVIVRGVQLDGPAFKAGIHTNDEILFIHNQRILRKDFEQLGKYLQKNKSFQVVVSRLGKYQELEVMVGEGIRKIKTII